MSYDNNLSIIKSLTLEIIGNKKKNTFFSDLSLNFGSIGIDRYFPIILIILLMNIFCLFSLWFSCMKY